MLQMDLIFQLLQNPYGPRKAQMLADEPTLAHSPSMKPVGDLFLGRSYFFICVHQWAPAEPTQEMIQTKEETGKMQLQKTEEKEFC